MKVRFTLLQVPKDKLQMIIRTRQFLDLCKKAGYKCISIDMKTELIPHTLHWPFDANGSVFGYPEICPNDWPPIWGITRQIGIDDGAGNSHQHQIKRDMLMSGVYQLKNRKWIKIN